MLGCLVLNHSLKHRDNKTTFEKKKLHSICETVLVSKDSWQSRVIFFCDTLQMVLELVIRMLGMKTSII